MQRLPRALILVLVLLSALLFAWPAAGDADEEKQPVASFKARAVSLPAGLSGLLSITVERWSTLEERQVLAAALTEGGSEALHKALFDSPRVGFIRFARTRAYEIRFARQIETEQGRRILLASDRPLGFVEAVNNLRSMDYNVGVIDFTVDAEGEGEGTMAPAVEVGFDPESGVLTLETYSIDPIRLLNLRQQE